MKKEESVVTSIESRVARKKKSNLKVTSAAVDSAAKVLEQEKVKQDEINRLIKENQALSLKISKLNSAGQSEELERLKQELKTSDAQIEQLTQSMEALSHGERFKVWLPVSKKHLSCSLHFMDANVLEVPSYNRRDQSLLTLENKELRSLYESLKVQQTDPVLVRKVIHSDQQVTHELVYGSRRSFCIRQLNKDFDPSRKIKAWVAQEMSLEDAKSISSQENEDRVDISPWEQAQYIRKLQEANPRWTQKQLAEEVGMTQANVSKYLSLQSIPVEVVRLLSSPMLLTVNGGKKVLKSLQLLTPAQKKELMGMLSGSFDSIIKLLRAMKEFQLEAPSSLPKRSKLIFTNRSGQVRGKLGEVRGKEGQYKVDLFDVSESELKSVQEFLDKFFKKSS